MATAKTLWIVVAVVLLAVLATPATRPMLNGGAMVSIGSVDLLDAPQVQATARRTGQGWALHAAAECLPSGSVEQWQAFDAALAAEPQDPVTLLGRAVHFVGALPRGEPARPPDELLLQHASQAAREAVAGAPANAAAYYLLAAAQLCLGHTTECRDAIRAGNAAPTCDSGVSETTDRLNRLLDALPETARPRMIGALMPPMTGGAAALREVARWSVAESERLRHDGDGRAAAQLSLDVARMGGRMRDRAGTLLEALTGVAVQAVAFRGTASPPARESGATSDAVRRHRRQFDLDQFARRLHEGGLAGEVSWARRETAKSQAVQQACLDHVRSQDAASYFAGVGRWAIGSALLLCMALVLLVSLLPRLLPMVRAEEPLVWDGANLLALGALALLPSLAAAAAAARYVFSPGYLRSIEHGGPQWLSVALPVAAVLLPWWVVRSALRWLGRRYADRFVVGADPRERRRSHRRLRRSYVRRSWPSVVSPLAATLLGLFLLSLVPMAGQHARLVARMRGYCAEERVVITQALATVAPAEVGTSSRR